MRWRAAVLAAAFAATVSVPARADYDYRWGVPDWRATWAAPKLADNRGFAVSATDDSVYVAGVTGQNGGDAVVLRYDLSGSLVWARTWGGTGLDQAHDLAVDGETTWVVGSSTAEDGSVRALVLGYAANGDLVHEGTFARGALDTLEAVTVHGEDVYVAGLTSSDRADRDLYVARLADGAPEWEDVFDGGEWDEAWDVAADDTGVYVAGYTTGAGQRTSDALVLRYNRSGGRTQTLIDGGGNDEARALALAPEGVYVTGGRQEGRSTDVFLALLRREGDVEWMTTTEGAVVGGGGYGVAVGDRGIYVAGGTYDFPAGGDAAILRFDRSGALEWHQVVGLPGFWDWGFGVDARDGRFYVSGVLWQPGGEWYRVLTLGFREDFPTTSLTAVARRAADGDVDGARADMDHFSIGDFLRWARALETQDASRSRIEWEGASNGGRTFGRGSVEPGRDPPASDENTAAAVLGLGDDVQSGNYALVRNYIAVSGVLADGSVRFRYAISHDRLVPQGGYVRIGELEVGLPPPPV